MKKDLTELVFIIDKSGSMGGLESDTIGGYNSVLDKQKALAGECILTTVLFNQNYELLHDRCDLRAVSPLTEKDYSVGGVTALLDAIGLTIGKIKKAHKHISPDYCPEKVMVVIITDGAENASREFDAETIKKQVSRQQEKHGWEFIFLGANIDSIKTASRYGFRRERAQNFHADEVGVEITFDVLNSAVCELRQCHSISENWNSELENDYKGRRTKR